MFERFTKPARSVVVGAQEEARGLRHDRIGTEHLLLSVLRHPEEPGAATLERLGVTAETCRAAVAALVTRDTDALGPEDAEALKALGIDLEEVRRRTEESFGPGALDGPAAAPRDKPRRLLPLGRRREEGIETGHMPFESRAKKALELSLREALALKDRAIGVEHVVLGLLRSNDRITLALFERLGIDPSPVRDLVLADRRAAA
ncbi:hypothetical protein LHJ74_29800 [Streptomyces sp. N2-109]|uniref:Clp R domain-containing protein n=1 Tax=Streptomyces gossypii TaxID=2883101 RepID=A0ABT2K1K4_9ACTN|nr:Clp protease N-terminal domain-containing protein [Streptomyces gossypii]MCT2594052.1 hypothetical protein [Streptomyces gossypii]